METLCAAVSMQWPRWFYRPYKSDHLQQINHLDGWLDGCLVSLIASHLVKREKENAQRPNVTKTHVAIGVGVAFALAG